MDSGGLTCLQCGYDLTGLVDTRCPECGATFAATEPQRRTQLADLLAPDEAPLPTLQPNLLGWIAVPFAWSLWVWIAVLLASGGLHRYALAAAHVLVALLLTGMGMRWSQRLATRMVYQRALHADWQPGRRVLWERAAVERTLSLLALVLALIGGAFVGP